MKLKKIIIGAVLCAALCLQPAAAADYVIHPQLDELIDLYTEYSLHGVGRETAVEEMLAKLLADRPGLLDDMGNALLTARDNYGGYYTDTVTEGIFYSDSFYGYGIRIDGKTASNGHNYNTVIKQVFGYSPAARAGLRPGDEIIKIDGVSVDCLGMQAVSHFLACGDKTGLTIRRGGEDITVLMDKSAVTVPPLYFTTDEKTKTALIEIEHFRDISLFYELHELLAYLEYYEFGNLIIDLRGNPGGSTDVMLECLNLFVAGEGAVLCSVVFKDGELLQRGSHDTLLTNGDGEYYMLWTAQAQHYKF